MSLDSPHPSFCSSPVTRTCKCGKKHKKEQIRCERCGRKLPLLKYCSNPKGKGTDHWGKGRCYLHGGRSGKAITPAGRVKCAQVNIKDGKYSKMFRSYLLSRKGEDAEQILELLETNEGLNAIMNTTIANLLIDYYLTGNVRAADLALKYLREALKTDREKMEKGLIKEEESVDLPKKIVENWFNLNEKEERLSKE